MKKKLMSILLSAAVSVSMVAGMGAVVYADTAEDNEAIKLEKVKEADSKGENLCLISMKFMDSAQQEILQNSQETFL